jgi:uncharacterized phage-associated protein
MQQKTKNNENQGSVDKKLNFPVPKSHTQMGSLSVKNVRKKSHAWAPLNKAFPKQHHHQSCSSNGSDQRH